MKYTLPVIVATLVMFSGYGPATSVAGSQPEAGSSGDGQFHISAAKAYLVGGEGDTGNSFRYDGSGVWTGTGQATIIVDDVHNVGTVVGTVTTHGHTYKIVLKEFKGAKPFMNGGIARDLYLHGTTGNGPPVLPKVWTYLAGWGHADVYKDGQLLHKNVHSHFMLTQGTRDKKTHRVNFSGPKQLMMAKKGGDHAKIQAAMQEIDKAAARAINTHTMQLHVVAHSDEKNPKHFPPFDWFTHFMWDDITWH